MSTFALHRFQLRSPGQDQKSWQVPVAFFEEKTAVHAGNARGWSTKMRSSTGREMVDELPPLVLLLLTMDTHFDAIGSLENDLIKARGYWVYAEDDSEVLRGVALPDTADVGVLGRLRAALARSGGRVRIEQSIRS